MDDETERDLLMRAREAYRHVDVDPRGFATAVSSLVLEARQADDADAVSHALRALGWWHRMRHEHERALTVLTQGVRHARRHAQVEPLGQLLMTRAAVHEELGRLHTARRDFDAAAHLLGDDVELMSQRAVLYANLGRLREAEALHHKILASADAPLGIRTKSANNLGGLVALKGRFAEALTLFDVAAVGAAEMGPVAVAMVREGRAWVTVQAGRITEGVALFAEAEQLWRECEMPLGELYAEYCDALADLRLLPEALDRARHAEQMLHGQGVELMAAEAGLRIAILALLQHDLAGAVTAAEQAAERFRRQHRATWAGRADLIACEARLIGGVVGSNDLIRARRGARTLERRGMSGYAVDAHLVAGRIAAALGRRPAALQSWHRAASLSRGSSLLVRLKGRLAAALAAAEEGRPELARRHSAAGLGDLALHREALPTTELRALASGHGEDLGRIGLAARVDTQPASRVLAWMERTRAAALSQTDVHESQEVGDDLGELRAVQAELVAARRETGAEPDELRARLSAIEQRIRRATWTSRTTTSQRGRALSPSELRVALGDRLLVEYDVLDGELLAAVLEPHRTRLVRLGPVAPIRHQLESLLFSMRYVAIASGPAAAAVAAAGRAGLGGLQAALVKPLQLPEHEHLVVVPVAPLHEVPWAALHSMPVSLAPSASMWTRSAAAAPPDNERVVLTAGPELPGAAAEVEALAAMHPAAGVLVPPESTVVTVAGALDRAALAHLACHCFVRSDNPTFSSLLLSDGYLTVHELDQRADVPHRVVLAACESGNDVAYAGNEVLGFVGTLMAKGSAGVVASSVVVPDDDLLPLMTSLHTGLARGSTMATALHDARGGLDPEDPATFVAGAAFNAFGAA